jgi:transcriptional regulator with XRE-family HTH domain
MDDRTLEQAIGAELKRLREASGALQEAVALAAQQYGLDWSQATISAIEAGRRGLSIGELGLLPQIVQQAKLSPTPVRVVDLIPETDEVVVMAGTLREPLRVARRFFGSPAVRIVAATGTAAGSATVRGVSDVVTEADRKAARKLRTTPAAIAVAAITLWGHDLAHERDRRIGDGVTTLPPRSLQAVRGRVTLALTRELQHTLKQWRKPKHGRGK